MFVIVLLIVLYGRIFIVIDSNDDGIKEDFSGDELICE